MTHEYGSARVNMVENQVRTNDVTDHGIQDAMGAVARERLCPPGRDFLAYAETPVEYAPGRFLMAPRDVAKLLQGLKPRPGERALAICAPYAALLLAEIGLSVTAVEPPGEAAEIVAKALADSPVAVTAVDPKTAGADGPYDLIICEGAVPAVPAAWLEAIGLGGRLGLVERNGPVGRAKLYLRAEDGVLASRQLFDASPPMLKGFEPARGFAF
jgi:protein-L-isoaspartate(D-aspartate) O-methyltransferase